MERKDKILAVCVLTACVAGLTYLTIRYQDACARYEAYQAKKELARHPVVERPPFGSNHIMTFGNISIYEDWGEWENIPNDGFEGPEDGILIRCVNNVPTDTMGIIGPYNRVVGYGNICKIVSGVDTIAVDITSPLPKSVDMRFIGMLPGCRKYTFS